jgi:hypothetical protein
VLLLLRRLLLLLLLLLPPLSIAAMLVLPLHRVAEVTPRVARASCPHGGR